MTSDRTTPTPPATAQRLGSGWPAELPRPQPPVWRVFDVEVDVRPSGDVVSQLRLDGGLTSGRGLASAGLVALLADCALGVDAALRGRSRIATAVLTVDFTGRPPETGVLRASSGAHSHRGGFLRTTATVVDGADAEVAQVSGWFALRGGPPVPAAPAVEPPGAARPPEGPHRARAAAGEAQTAADPTTSPLGRRLGLASFTRGRDGAVAFELPDVGPLCNSGGTLHGGVAALMATVAALATLDDGRRPAPEVLSMTCQYLRAAGGDGGPVRVTGSQIRRGRTSAVVRGDVLTADGRPAMHTVVTAALHP